MYTCRPLSEKYLPPLPLKKWSRRATLEQHAPTTRNKKDPPFKGRCRKHCQPAPKSNHPDKKRHQIDYKYTLEIRWHAAVLPRLCQVVSADKKRPDSRALSLSVPKSLLVRLADTRVYGHADPRNGRNNSGKRPTTDTPGFKLDGRRTGTLVGILWECEPRGHWHLWANAARHDVGRLSERLDRAKRWKEPGGFPCTAKISFRRLKATMWLAV